MAEAEKFTSKGQAWFCATGLPSDIEIEVDGMIFHLHKFPLMSKSRKLHDMITALESSSTAEEEQEEGNESNDVVSSHRRVTLPDFPGGSEAFEAAAKFCYGIKMELSAANVAPLRCAGEFLHMTEEYSEDNLIAKTERLLSQSVLKNLKDSIKTLKSCQNLMPMAENLGIVQRCIDSISSKANQLDPSLFGWPVTAGEGDSRRITAAATPPPWLDDMAELSVDFFNIIISTMREKEMNCEIIERFLIHYAKRSFPGISRSKGKKPPLSSAIASETDQRKLLETITANLPLEKSSNASTATRFLFGLLRTANILNASESCKSLLERKIGAQLEQSTLDDLLIPSYSYLNETLYDVDCIQRILGHFLDFYEQRSIEIERESVGNVRSPAIMIVGKLIDGYLSEIASDANLKPEKFTELAVSLPEQARLYDDGLYRAVDVYLKSHPWISEEERERICGVMDCQKLTLEACTHAAQNERLPVRAVVQVLFFEQLQLRHAIAGTLLATSAADNINSGDEERDSHVGGAVAEESATWRNAIRENQVLRLDMDSMRTRVHELERECSTMRRAIEKINTAPPQGGSDGGAGGVRWRSTLTRKFGCKFKTQVCDSHEPTVVDGRKGRHQSNHHR